MHLIKKIIDVKPYQLTLCFDDDKIGVVDLKEKLELWSKNENSIFRELLDTKKFMMLKLHDELKTTVWENGVDFCPDMLYEWSDIKNRI